MTEKELRRGAEVLSDALSNRFCGFALAERERLGLVGLLPSAHFTIEEETALRYEQFRALGEEGTEERVRIQKFLWLTELQNENETLFFKLLSEHVSEMAPIVYTPTVGWFCANYSRALRRPRGLFVTPGNVAAALANWPRAHVDAIVVTDGSRVLGLGDLGVGGMGISVGKMVLYVAGGGFDPARVMPVALDVGTDNAALLADPRYIGLRRPRLDGEAYTAFVDEFMERVTAKWPNALVQFEDFQFKHAATLLARYRDRMLVFNDDIQGTAATVLAALLGAMRVRGLDARALADQRFVIVGHGGAGRGIMSLLKEYLCRCGLGDEEARRRFFVVGRDGLIATRPGLTEPLASFARPEPDCDRLPLAEVIRRFRATALIGVSGTAGLFTPEALRAMAEVSSAPLIFPLSNPTANAECTAEEAFAHAGVGAIFGSGSPFSDVEMGGKLCKTSIINNVYLYPGLALGAFLGRTGVVSEAMLLAAAEGLAETSGAEQSRAGSLFPPLDALRALSANVAARVMQQANSEGRLSNAIAAQKLSVSFEALRDYIGEMQWKANYSNEI